MTRNKKIIALVFVAIWIWSAINPVSRTDWFLENLPVFAVFLVLIFSKVASKFSDLSFILVAIFIVLHLLGTHYTYEQVPFGFTLEQWLGSTRNMYDRLVHFAFGFLLVIPLLEVSSNFIKLRHSLSYYVPVITVLAGAGVYEIFEWGVANFVSPRLSITFIGSQGDLWDTQKDMAMAFFGAIVMTIIVVIWRKYRQRSTSKNLI